MQITTIDKGRYTATFNRRNLVITGERSIKAVDAATGEILTGPEPISIRRLVAWHLKSKNTKNELSTLWTIRP